MLKRQAYAGASTDDESHARLLSSSFQLSSACVVPDTWALGFFGVSLYVPGVGSFSSNLNVITSDGLFRDGEKKNSPETFFLRRKLQFFWVWFHALALGGKVLTGRWRFVSCQSYADRGAVIGLT